MPASVKSWFNWEFRPAVQLADGRVVADVGNGWEDLDRVSGNDVLLTAGVIGPDRFREMFPEADASTIPDKPDS